MEERKIQWHPAFAAAMDLEFAENREDLISEKEYCLNSQPIKVDLLVIKKKRGIRIKNEIGAIFRGYNVLEYKCPKDSINIDDVYKTIAYASLYKAQAGTVDGIKADDITISLVRHARPKKLFAYFRQHGHDMSSPCSGVYYIEGFLFPLQIVVGKELGKEQHLWLRALSEHMDKNEMMRLIKKTGNLNTKQDRESASSVLAVSTDANRKILEAMKGDKAMYEKLIEILQPEFLITLDAEKKKARDDGWKEGMEDGREEGHKEGMEDGWKEGRKNTLDEISKKLEKLNVSPDIITEICSMEGTRSQKNDK